MAEALRARPSLYAQTRKTHIPIHVQNPSLPKVTLYLPLWLTKSTSLPEDQSETSLNRLNPERGFFGRSLNSQASDLQGPLLGC